MAGNRDLPGRRVTVRAQIAAIVAAMEPNAICDRCLTEMLGLKGTTHASTRTRELARLYGFLRESGKCHRCREQRLVISRLR